MAKFKVGKLVRDKLAQQPSCRGVRALSGDEYLSALKLKLLEEACEVNNAITPEELAEELADIQEVVEALVHAAHLDPKTIAEIKDAKKVEKGGFEAALYVDHVEAEPGSALEKYCLKAKDKYPKIA